MGWEIDPIFETVANKAVLKYLCESAPSAHSDLVDELSLAVQDAPGSSLYCPDKAKYAFFAAHRLDYTIVALALGMKQIAFRLPEDLVPEALHDGAVPFPAIGSEWVSFAPSSNDEPLAESRRRLGRWCSQALISDVVG